MAGTEGTEGRGVVDPQGRGVVDPQGRGVVDPQGRGVVDPQGRGVVDPQGRGVVDPQGRGVVDPQGRGDVDPQGRGVAVVTDSSACLPPTVRGGNGDVRIIPLTVHFALESSSDDRLTLPDVYRAQDLDETLKTSPPRPLDYLEAVEASAADGVVVVTPAAEFTVMHHNAGLAAKLADVPVAVVDSRSAAGGQGLVVLAALEAVRSGATAAGVAAAARRAARQVELVAKLETVEYVARGGRISSTAFGFAARMGIRPVFALRRGAVEPLGIPQSVDAALGRIAEAWHRGGGPESTAALVFHAGREDEADELRHRLGHPADVVEFSPAMTVHTGRGVVGVAWLRR